MDRPCLCHDGYTCTQHYTAQARQRMVDNKLAALAKDFELIDDDQWCVLLYLHVQDDLDLLLFQGEAS
jgi:cell division protein ZapA (FtsZ GTPase activity inhibitor)